MLGAQWTTLMRSVGRLSNITENEFLASSDEVAPEERAPKTSAANGSKA